LALAQTLKLGQKAQPVRRVWIPKPQSTELRPLGIPVMANRAGQALVTAALEPEWEARFEPNSYGFRPGRSCQDAIDAIFASIAGQAKYVLDADIAQCFDRLSHSAILTAVHTSPSIRRQLKAWLKAGVIENGELFPTPVGTIQGGNISPLLINIALHGLETLIGTRFRRNGCTGFNPPRVILYADDIVILHRDEQIVRQCQELVSVWLKERGLELKPSKTRITHTLLVPEGTPGFAFLGFAIRHYPVGKTRSAKDTRGRLLGYKTRIVPSPEAIQHHVQQLRTIIKSHRHASQEALIRLLNPVIVGWARYYARVGSAGIFQSLDNRLYGMLRAWATYRHPNKGKRWIAHRYWCFTTGHGWIFQPPRGAPRLYRHGQTAIRRHVKVHGVRSPYDGDWVYWSTRLGQHPGVSPRVARLLKRQQGKCAECGLFFAEGDRMEVDHIIPQGSGGTDRRDNLQLLHRHCHDRKTASDPHRPGTCDKRHGTEEPCEGLTLMHGFGAEPGWWHPGLGSDKEGHTIDFLLTPNRDRDAAEAFLHKAIRTQGLPEKITIDQSGANTKAIEHYNRDHHTAIIIRHSKYLNNLIEQDHRAVKRLVRPILGFKSIWAARCTIAGIEVMHAIRKGPLVTAGEEYQTPADQFYSLAA
jgi:RNA-directed DNA polymerase